ncbi:chemotaxis protein CheW [Suttonella ornithocola]|uniref:CheW-like domain n=1 Tax=Suttonella ornithocola TaxID=279832 RepID=A0A380MS08_9GAMM|nr:chemotaxis protein CheW [Suttonella ornithocola]SUO95345.1 CheW-like domain [Suttonella ornithocola]
MNAEVQALKMPFEILLGYQQQYLSRKETQTQTQTSNDSYLAFKAGNEYYLLSMTNVFEVATDINTITPLPFTPVWLLGLTSRRTDIYSVVELKSFIDKAVRPSPKNIGSYIILREAGQGYILKVDIVFGIREYSVTSLQTQQSWIDGHIHLEDKNWLRINLGNLVTDNSFIQF